MSDCRNHWHCDPRKAAHSCNSVDRTQPCPTCEAAPGVQFTPADDVTSCACGVERVPVGIVLVYVHSAARCSRTHRAALPSERYAPQAPSAIASDSTAPDNEGDDP